MFFIFRPRGLSYLTVGVSRTSVAAEYYLKCHRRVFKETFKRIPRLAHLRPKCPNPATIKAISTEADGNRHNWIFQLC
jgi:hypothetical protein